MATLSGRSLAGFAGHALLLLTVLSFNLTGASVSLRSPVCEACQAWAALVLRGWTDKGTRSNDGGPTAAEILASASLALEAAESPASSDASEALAWASGSSGASPKDLADRCQRFLAADRHILRRLVKSAGATGAPPSWQKVTGELCLQRLRCPESGLWATESPWVEQSEMPKGSSTVPPNQQLEAKEDDTTYKRMLATYKAAAGTWTPSFSSESASATETPDHGRASEPLPSVCSGASCRADDMTSGLDRMGSAAQRDGSQDEDEELQLQDPLMPRCKARKDSYQDLASTRIVVVVFSGRKDRLRILLRYLHRDLRKNGGVVDKVIFALWQHTPQDLAYLQQEVAAHGGNGTFEIQDFSVERWGRPALDADPATNNMVQLYQSLKEPDTVYVKVDDDVVFIEQHAIAQIVRERLRGRCLMVSANVVNHAIMSALHQDRGAHRGFWPPDEQVRNPSLRLPWVKTTEINV
ncbi:unnamed protein product, partial [Polarella glacialis]